MKRICEPLVYRRARNDWEQSRTTPGTAFEVIRSFADVDGDFHRPGERWTLLGTRFNKFENEIDLGVRAADGADWLITLGWDKERQLDVIEDWKSYIRNLA